MNAIVYIAPLSVNKAWQGRRFKTPEHKAWERAVLLSLPKRDMVRGLVRVTYEFGLTPRTFAITDTGNLEKCFTDCLVKRGYIEDDRYIIEMALRKVKSDHFYIKVDISPV